MARHPDSLRIFIFTEMWERYGFYVVQSLLALFLALHFKWPDERVYGLVGSFTALNYLSPLIGGWIADHLLGQKKTVILGAIVLMLSYLALSQMQSDAYLTVYLATISIGTGLLKPNISSLLGHAYDQDVTKREGGFMLFYTGIALGIILGTTLPSMIHAHFGWSVAFLSASISMLGAVTFFILGIYRYHILDYHPTVCSIGHWVQAMLIVGVLGLGAYWILNDPRIADGFILLSAGSAVAYLVFLIRQEEGIQARKTKVIALLCLISVFFWSFYFQIYMSLTLFILRLADPLFKGLHIYPPYYIGLQSIGLVMIGYLLSSRKSATDLMQYGTRTAHQFLLGLFCIFLAYVGIVLLCRLDTSSVLFSPLYFIPIYLLISFAEIYISPVGLSAMTALSSPKKVSTMVGMFFVTLGLGAFFSGKLATLTALPAQSLSVPELKMHYAHTFGLQCILLFVFLMISIGLNGSMRKLLKPLSLSNKENE